MLFNGYRALCVKLRAICKSVRYKCGLPEHTLKVLVTFLGAESGSIAA